MRRVVIFDRADGFVAELTEGEVFGLVRSEEINGEHSLEVTTTRPLELGWRIVTQDATGKWREHVVYGTDELHSSGEKPVGTYWCTWSLQHDLMGVQVSAMPGVRTPCSARHALEALLGATARWSAGTVGVTALAGASMYDMSAWEALSVLVATWGGEVDASIEVSGSSVLSRSIDLHAAQGEQDATRRFDFGADLASVRRKMPDGPLYCRISPRGMGEETEAGGYGRKIRITDVNDGLDYLENRAMVDLAKLPDGSGGWEYPTVIAENPQCETPEDLLAWARGVLEDYTVPKVTYTVDVVQASAEGVDMAGVALGDAVHLVDRKLGGGLRLTGRVSRMVVDELAERNVQVTIGDVAEGIAGVVTGMMGTLRGEVSSLLSTVRAINGGTMSTADYLSNLIARLNAEINATGGFTYITEGHGLRTYDRAVSDPLVGDEADAVVEIKGGTVRIANSRTSSSDWDWKTVFTSGHIAGELVTAAQIVAGYIRSAGGTFIDLDNDTVQLGADSQLHAVFDADSFDLYTPQGTYDARSITHFGYGDTVGPYGTLTAPYFTFGERKTNTSVGSHSVAEGYLVEASMPRSHAEGQNTKASGLASHAEGSATTASGDLSHAEGGSSVASGDYSHAEGYSTASGDYSHAEGWGTEASSDYSHASGYGTRAQAMYQSAIGKYNAYSSGPFVVGYGSVRGNEKNVLDLSTSGALWIAGALTQNSDRRLKEHVSYLGEDACEFVRRLKPALFAKDGARHLGFYAQNVLEADSWDTATVEAKHTDESLDFDPLTLDYSALIAPLTAYAQALETRVEALERRLFETNRRTADGT